MPRRSGSSSAASCTAMLAAAAASRRPCSVGSPRGEGLAEGVDGDRRGDLAAAVAAHAVGDGPQPVGVGDERRVLVDLPDLAGVARGAGPQLGHPRTSNTVLPICTRSPALSDDRAADLRAVHEGAVGGAEVLDPHRAVGGAEDAGVEARDVGVVGHGDGAPAGPPDGELAVEAERVPRRSGGSATTSSLTAPLERRLPRVDAAGGGRRRRGRRRRRAAAGPGGHGGGAGALAWRSSAQTARRTRKKKRYRRASRQSLRIVSSCSDMGAGERRRGPPRRWRRSYPPGASSSFPIGGGSRRMRRTFTPIRRGRWASRSRRTQCWS